MAGRRENDSNRVVMVGNMPGAITPGITEGAADRGGHVYPVKPTDYHLSAMMTAPATAASNRFKPAKKLTAADVAMKKGKS